MSLSKAAGCSPLIYRKGFCRNGGAYLFCNSLRQPWLARKPTQSDVKVDDENLG